ncbi:MAG: cytidylate kinase-like family protein [Deltaproteobacteria bacterium]|nr:cytidylate kinase-like family protein [Deltaproteobacteria bacterium]
MKQTSPLVITISRQLGSGGAYVGQQLAKKLNIFYADGEIIGQAAQQLSVLQEALESRDEKILSFWQSFLRSFAIATDVYVPSQVLPPTDRELFNAESEIIERIAKERSAVIVGRCGSHILSDHPNHVSIFLHGDITFRKGRIQKLFNVSEEVAGKMIAQNDKERALYHQTFTGKEWTDARQYDISLDTGKIGVDETGELILKYLDFQVKMSAA